MTEPKKKASGANVEEWQRGTTKVQLRLPPDVAATIRERAKGTTSSGYVAELVVRDERRREREDKTKPWAERVAAGLCGACGTDRPLETASMCAPCCDKARAAQERHRER